MLAPRAFDAKIPFAAGRIVAKLKAKPRAENLAGYSAEESARRASRAFGRRFPCPLRRDPAASIEQFRKLDGFFVQPSGCS